MMSAAAAADNTAGTIGGIIILVVAALAYWSPVLVGWRRHARNLRSIAVLTAFSFLLVPWIVAMAMAVADKPVPPDTGA